MPNLSERQNELLNYYYLARREVDGQKRIKLSLFKSFFRYLRYEKDVAEEIFKRIDDHYMKLVFDKMKRDAARLAK